MELSPISKLSFLNNRGEVIKEPKEWELISIIVNLDVKDWDSYSLMINDQPEELSLKKINGDKKIITDQVRLGAGKYKVSLNYKNEIINEYIHIYPSKLTEMAYRHMIEELAYKLPADISISLSKANAYTGINITKDSHTTISQELVHLNRIILGGKETIGLINILNTVVQKPHHILKTQDLLVRREEVRRPNPNKIARSLLNGGGYSDLPSKFMDQRVEHSYDVYENQLLKLFIQQVYSKIRKLKKLLEILKYPYMINEIESLYESLTKTLKNVYFLKFVSVPKNFLVKSSMVLLNIPIYRAIFEGFIQFQKTITVNLEENELKAPLENSPVLYQKWGTLKVLSLLLNEAEKHGYLVLNHHLYSRLKEGTTIKVLPNGKSVLTLQHPHTGTIIKFIPEKSFAKNSSPLKSMSFTQRPDITIEVTRRDGNKSVYIFDPKYKLNSEQNALTSEITYLDTPKKEDIDKMHAYRDAILNNNGERVVKFAGILYPGKTVYYHDGLKAIQTVPLLDNSFEDAIKEVISDILQN